MADFKISRIRFRWVGNWTSGYSYVKDDVVRYGGKTYVALKTHTSSPNFYTDFETLDAQIPPQPDPYWELMFDGFEWTSQWQEDTFYQIGDLAKKNGIVYICIESHTSVMLETDFSSDLNNNYWIVYTSTDNWRYFWTPNTSYSLNDVISYNGIIYRCIGAHVSGTDGPGGTGLEVNQEQWEAITDTELWRDVWTVETRYRKNDLVRYNGIVYRCIQGHTSADNEEDGLELDISNWTIFYENIEYKGTWSPSSFRYKKNDIVKYGAGLWICTEYHISSATFDEDYWIVYLPGFEYENSWISTTEYQKGDIVNYGGYNYFALTNNINQIPSEETDDWELLITNYKIREDWSVSTSYKVGDVVRRGGMLYVAIVDNIGEETTNTTYWELLISGEKWIGRWASGQTYLIGDIITYISTSYRCLVKHLSSNSNRPDIDTVNWTKLVEGNRANVLAEIGDIKTYGIKEDGSSIGSLRRPIENLGDALTVVDGEVRWEKFNEINKVYYVATDGDNDNDGLTLETPWATIKHACANITGPATIFVKTGVYYEEGPISIPANVALVGDELRGTTVIAAPGYTAFNMFYVRDGSGIRNMTLKGLEGTLGPINEFGTRRPTAGAYVSLDPGNGIMDTDVWIVNRSPYIQNVTTFGTACVGLKVDGSLHGGGNSSIVANDFTQVLSDGIGAWVTNSGLSELVSVFTYYNHIGYLAEDGGKIRGTNGNCSYGTFGAVAESFAQDESPITALVNNRSKEALVSTVFCSGGEIQKLQFSNAGQNYSSASITFSGAGVGASATITEFRDEAIYQNRIYTPGDSSSAGGGSYLDVLNSAQTGDQFSITISAADDNTETNYFGMRIVIVGGTGAGQYGIIYNYDDVSKIALVLKESDDQGGWDHIIPGTPIETLLDNTTVYRIEPRVTFSFPGFTATGRTLPNGLSWNKVKYYDGNFIAIATGSTETAISTNATSWTTGGNLPSSANWSGLAVGDSSGTPTWVAISTASSAAAYSTNNGTTWISASLPSSGAWSDVAFGNGKFIAVKSSSTDAAIAPNGTVWSSIGALPSGAGWSSIAYGQGVWVVVSSGSSTQGARSTDDGSTWAPVTLPAAANWSSVTYGNGRFVAIANGSSNCAYSFDGLTWYLSTNISSQSWTQVSYGQGVFLAIATGSAFVAYSNDGNIWKSTGDDSTAFSLQGIANWSSLAFGNPDSSGIWSVISSGGTIASSIKTGARAIGRARVISGRVSEISILDPGSGYVSTPTVTVTDPNKTSSVFVRIRVGNGVISGIHFVSKGSGYLTETTTASITGNGFSDNYQTGDFLILSNVSVIPGPGDNLVISGINDLFYKIVTIETINGVPGNYNIRISLSPTLGIEESPDHNTPVEIRQNYSQVRLTGHDFLDIGAGNFENANYPNIPQLLLAPENEVYEKNGGRVFYTSTDQDGNFRCGELFRVEQATGTVTISASLFNLTGLSEIALGGVTIGGTNVVIREFSTDSTFTADSNNIIPTQRAIKAYLQASISGGGSNALTTIITAGVVRIGPQSITTTTLAPLQMPNKVAINGEIDGSMLAFNFFLHGFSNDLDFDIDPNIYP